MVQAGRRLIAIGAKGGDAPKERRGLTAFKQRFGVERALLVGEDGVSPEDFFSRTV
jgi:hypothetical protein